MSPAEIDRVLAVRGIHYEVRDDGFYDGRRPLEFGEVVALLAGVTGEDLASYLYAKCNAFELLQPHMAHLAHSPVCHCIDYD